MDTTTTMIVRLMEHLKKAAQWCYQHTTKSGIILTLSFLTTVFSILGVADCSFMLESPLGISPHDLSMNRRIGLFNRAVYDTDGALLGCVAYTDKNSFDAKFRAGRAFGILTVLFVGLANTLFATNILFLPPASAVVWVISQYLLIMGTITQMFTFFAVGSNFACAAFNCPLTGVGVLAAINVVLLVGFSISVYLTPPPTRSWFIWWDAEADRRAKQAPVLGRLDPQVRDYLSQYKQFGRRSPQIAPGLSPHLDEASFEGNDNDQEEQSGFTETTADTTNSKSSAIHGLRSFRFTLVALFSFAWAGTLAAVDRCTLISVGPTGAPSSQYASIGLFTRAVTDNGTFIGCIAFPNNSKVEFDQSFNTSRVFGGVTSFLMTFVYLLILFLLFVKTAKEEIWQVVRMVMPVATVSQLLVFVAFHTKTCTADTNVDCRLGTLGIWTVLNTLIMTILTILVMNIPAPPHPVFMPWFSDDNTEAAESRISQSPLEKASPITKQSRVTVLDSSSMRLVNENAQLPRISEDEDTQTYPVDNSTHTSMGTESPSRISSRITRIEPLPESPYPLYDHDPGDSINVTVEYCGNEKRIVKTLTHPDGSQTITITVEELSIAGSVDEDDRTIENLEEGGEGRRAYDSLLGQRGDSSEDVNDSEQFSPNDNGRVQTLRSQKRTVKTLTHPDGSQTITITVEELSIAGSVDEDDRTIENLEEGGEGRRAYDSLLGPRGDSSEDVNDSEQSLANVNSRAQTPRGHHRDGIMSTNMDEKNAEAEEIILVPRGESNQSCTPHLESVVVPVN